MPHTHDVPETIADLGCYLDNHRGHYITRDAIELAIGYGFIIGGMDRFVLDMYDDHGHDDTYQHEDLQGLCDDAVEWLNSGQGECENCTAGRDPRDGVYWTRADDPDNVKRCKVCTGTGRAPRVDGQNFPPRIPDGAAWSFFDGDFGLYAIEDLEG